MDFMLIYCMIDTFEVISCADPDFGVLKGDIRSTLFYFF